jgi:hypothetical protein
LIEDDPLMGQPARHLATLGGLACTHDAMMTADELLARAADLR